jgi:hypothetical protein
LAAAAVVTGAALTATYLQDQRDPTLILAAFGAGGMPIVSQWVPTHCHAPTRNSSAIRLDRKELLALLEKK